MCSMISHSLMLVFWSTCTLFSFKKPYHFIFTLQYSMIFVYPLTFSPLSYCFVTLPILFLINVILIHSISSCIQEKSARKLYGVQVNSQHGQDSHQTWSFSFSHDLVLLHMLNLANCHNKFLNVSKISRTT